MFKTQFDVEGYEPDDIDVKIGDGSLMVSGKHQDDGENGEGFIKEFNQEVALPDDVLIDELNCSISDEGVLTIQAPYSPGKAPKEVGISLREIAETVDDNNYSPNKYSYGSPKDRDDSRPEETVGVNNYSYGSPKDRVDSRPEETVDVNNYSHESPKDRVDRTGEESVDVNNSSCDSPNKYSYGSQRDRVERKPEVSSNYENDLSSHMMETHVTSSTNGNVSSFHTPNGGTDTGRKYLKVVNLMFNGYQPDEVNIIVGRSRIHVKGKHLDKRPGTKFNREYSRKFDTPDELEFSSVRAMLRPDGKITIGASLKVNDNHDEVIALFMVEDMPEDGDIITVEAL